MTGAAPLKGALKGSERAVEDAADSPWVRGLGRWGLVVRGILYLVVAALALRIAQGRHDERVDKQGALQAVARQPVGKILLVVLAIGLGGYALWRFSEAVLGPSGRTDKSKATLKRVGSVLRGLVYVGLMASAIGLVVQSSAKKGGANSREVDSTARVLGWPGGRLLVTLIGIGIIGAGAYIGWRGVSRKFRKRLKMVEMSPVERRTVTVMGIVGHLSRMVVAVIVGVFLIAAANNHDPGEAVGIDGALKRLEATQQGPLLLTGVAAGLAAYGLYSFAEARYRRLDPA